MRALIIATDLKGVIADSSGFNDFRILTTKAPTKEAKSGLG